MAKSERPGFHDDYDRAYRGDLEPPDDRPYLADEEWWPEYDADILERRAARRMRSRDFRAEEQEPERGYERRMRVRRRSDRAARGESGYYPGHRVPRDFRRYRSSEEYGLGGSGYGRDYAGGADAGPRPPRDIESARSRHRRRTDREHNALFGGEGFRRYDRDYDER